MCAYRKVRRVNSGQRRPARRQSEQFYDEDEYPEHYQHQRRPAHGRANARNYRMQPKTNNTPIIVISVVVGVLLIGVIVFVLSSKNIEEADDMNKQEIFKKIYAKYANVLKIPLSSEEKEITGA